MSDHGHEIIWEFFHGNLQMKVVCHEPNGADCRLQAPCGCESWENFGREADGRPYHDAYVEEGGDRDGGETARHYMEPMDECNIALSINESDCPEEMVDGDHSFEIGRTPVTGVWDDYGYLWKPIKEEA